MPKSTKARLATASTPDPKHLPKGKVLNVTCPEGGDTGKAMAKVVVGPHYASTAVIDSLTGSHFGDEYSLMAVIETLKDHCQAVNKGEMQQLESMLTSQAFALNLMQAELTRRAFGNFGAYLDSGERYLRLALKAQNQCRMTLETLSTIKNPPVVYARQANINNGGQQQVNNREMPTRVTNPENSPSKLLERSNEQRMDTGTASRAGQSDSALEAVEICNWSQNT